ncbi:hypothetical protein [Streptomyces aidingensis]|uniref:Copper/zinc superoxide dismutase (SODC) n=1 Tax=Streptomyces aidingensis TaxID=910347 RepID=A0A1I1V0C2_9ACTN|nr:hypothetical protein [Streptomyces aidingensis]SFD76497.1 Copper/zinc superoxide dismutase (SODC) [Streptomyces aidingensis]
MDQRTPQPSAARRAGRRTALAACLLTTAALLLTGCGGDSSAAAGPDTGGESGHEAHGMADTAMGDPSATPAADIPGAEVRQAPLTLLDTRPPGTDGVRGTAWLAQHEGGTTVTVSMTGLEPGTDYISHLHLKACAEENGGDHFRFDPDGSDLPPNEIHLAFTGDAQGRAEMTVENDRRTGDAAASLVVHPRDAQDNRLACADF